MSESPSTVRNMTESEKANSTIAKSNKSSIYCCLNQKKNAKYNTIDAEDKPKPVSN